MIAVCDVNAIWRYRPFAAMAELTDVIAFAPSDLKAARCRTPRPSGVLDVVDVLLPPGWASRTGWLGQRLLWKRIQAEAKRRGKQVDCVVVTSPHYNVLLDLIPDAVKSVYYASDDYRSYDGWGNMAELEKKIVRRVDHSFFISEALARRALDEYGSSRETVSVSMNGSEDRFFFEEDERVPNEPPFGAFSRPIAGVVGGISDRLDFELLKKCADVETLGTLLLVGPIPESPSPELLGLLAHPKCACVGAQPHETIHAWFKCLDVGLIPYVSSNLNTYCSPMRLFDHLASGQPIVSTDACDQVNAFSPPVVVCSDASAFAATLDRIARDASSVGSRQDSSGAFHRESWRCRAEAMLDIINDL